MFCKGAAFFEKVGLMGFTLKRAVHQLSDGLADGEKIYVYIYFLGCFGNLDAKVETGWRTDPLPTGPKCDLRTKVSPNRSLVQDRLYRNAGKYVG